MQLLYALSLLLKAPPLTHARKSLLVSAQTQASNLEMRLGFLDHALSPHSAAKAHIK